MAFAALDRLMFAPKLESRGRMIKRSGDFPFPTFNGMAAFARLCKLPDMWIVVARRTLREGKTDKSHGSTAALMILFVTALACNTKVLSGELEFRAVMHKPGGWLPSLSAVALFAPGCQLTSVLVFMTRQAFSRKTQVGPRLEKPRVILHVRSLDMRRSVTFAALKTPMLSFKNKASLAVIKTRRIQPE